MVLTGERGETMAIIGLQPDELQLRAEELIEQRRAAGPRDTSKSSSAAGTSHGTDRAAAGLHRRGVVPARPVPASVTDLAELRRGLRSTGTYEAYCGRLELLLRDLKAQGVKHLGLTPIADRRVSRLVQREQPRTRGVRHPHELRHDAHRTRPRATVAAANETTPAGAAANASTRNAASAPDDSPTSLELRAHLTRKSRKSRRTDPCRNHQA